jgi:RNA polymerase sigma factor (sigma-70 family)
MREEFEKLYRKKKTIWLKVLQKIVSNPTDAEDILQDALCRALFHLDKYDPTRGGMNNWFTKVMFSEMKDYFIRNKKNEKNLPIEWYDEIIEYESKIENKCALEQSVDLVTSVLDKKIIELTYIQGYKMEDVSLILKVSQGKISSTTTKFKQLLKETSNASRG